MVIAEVIICGGGSCDVPKDWLQTEWREKGIWRSVGLIFSECMGYCEEAVNIRILTKHATHALNNVQTQETYQEIIDWAKRVHDSKQLEPLPTALTPYEKNHFTAS